MATAAWSRGVGAAGAPRIMAGPAWAAGSGSWGRRAALTAALVLLYYAFSIGITFYNKWIMKSFGFPLFMTLLHLLVIFALSGAARAVRGRCQAKKAAAASSSSSSAARRRPRAPLLAWPGYLRRVAPAALSTALDVGLSNWSFLYITVSLYTMTKSSAVLFILFFSLVFKLEEPRAALVLVVLLVAGGLFLFTYRATQFETEGFLLVLGASFLGGVRWTLTQMLLQKEELGLQNPIDTMFHLQPLMFLGLFPLFAAFEGLPLSSSEKLFRFHEGEMLVGLLGKLALGGLLAFGLGFSEFLLVSRTSSLALSISGIFKGASFCLADIKPYARKHHLLDVCAVDSEPLSDVSPKEVCTLLLATQLLGDRLSLLNWCGFAICLLGISLHVALKALGAKGQRGTKPHKEAGSGSDLELLLLQHQEEPEAEYSLQC